MSNFGSNLPSSYSAWQSAAVSAAWGLGAAGGFGVSILVLGFGMQPGSPPVSVLLIITAVIACTSVLQGSGGLDYLVGLAEKLLR